MYSGGGLRRGLWAPTNLDSVQRGSGSLLVLVSTVSASSLTQQMTYSDPEEGNVLARLEDLFYGSGTEVSGLVLSLKLCCMLLERESGTPAFCQPKLGYTLA